MTDVREPMDFKFAVFNGHANDADKRARALLGAVAPKMLERVEAIEREQNGIMGIFNVAPENATMAYAAMVTAYVNEGHRD